MVEVRIKDDESFEALLRRFSKKVSEHSDRFEIMDESEISRIVVLQNNKRFTERFLSAYA